MWAIRFWPIWEVFLVSESTGSVFWHLWRIFSIFGATGSNFWLLWSAFSIVGANRVLFSAHSNHFFYFSVSRVPFLILSTHLFRFSSNRVWFLIPLRHSVHFLDHRDPIFWMCVFSLFRTTVGFSIPLTIFGATWSDHSILNRFRIGPETFLKFQFQRVSFFGTDFGPKNHKKWN